MAEIERRDSRDTGQRALAAVHQARTRFVALPSQKKIWLVTGAVVVFATILAFTWYTGRPDWRVLFSGLESKDVQTVTQELAAAGIPFQATADGTGVQVPADLLDKSRMEVAAKGMPQTGRLGFELFDKPNWVGSEFDERVNYQRALEGELEHTIATLGAVRSARVHLVLPQASLFLADEKVAKASVVLKLKKTTLTAEQTEAIRNLVAGAVENLNAEQVTLVDADGRVNLQAKGRTPADGDGEQIMEAKLIAMLEPLAGTGNVRATVNVRYEQGSEERTDEIYDPALTATLSVQKSEQVSGSTSRAQGVPGTASNTPAAAPVGAVQGSSQAAAPGVPPLLQSKETLPIFPQNGGTTQNLKEESGTYAVTKHLVHMEEGPGRVKRITAAVVVNDRMMLEGIGKSEHAVWKARTAEEMHRLEALAQAAVGFDERRGDQVVMENVSFTSNAPELKVTGVEKIMEEAKGILGTQPGVLKTGMIGLLGVLVICFVLRPVVGQMVTTIKEPALLGSGQRTRVNDEGRDAGEAISHVSLLANDEESEKGIAASQTTEAQRRARRTGGHAIFEQVSEHIKREPVQSTRLLEAWIGAVEDGD